MTAPVWPAGGFVKSGKGASSHVMVFSVQLLEVAHNIAPKAFDVPAQHLNVALVIAVPDGMFRSNLKKLYFAGLASIATHGVEEWLVPG